VTHSTLRSYFAKRSPLGASLTPTTRGSRVAAGCTRHALWLPVTVALALSLTSTVQAGLYTQNFGSATVGDTGASLSDGSNMVGTVTGITSVQSVPSSGNALRLIDQSGGSFGNWFLPNLDPGVAVTSFTASFDSLIYNSGGTTPGDTLGFNFGTITNTTSAYTNGGTGGMYEVGKAVNLLTVSFRTYQVGRSPPETREIQVWYNNTQINSNIGTPVVSSVLDASAYQVTTISWDASTGLSVNYGGSSLVSGLAIPGFTPVAGDTFAFNGFDGAATQSVYIDNVSIQTVPEPSTSLIAFAGLACGGFSMWRRRKRA
jgi:hypothetical protein